MWVYDKAAWDNKTEHIQVKISTKNVPDFMMYDDPATPVDLVRYNGGAKNESGWFWSNSQMLVSNEVDDKYADAVHLGADDVGPGADGPQKEVPEKYTWQVSDRTHRVALDGTVKAEYTPAGGKPISAQANVPAIKSVKLHVNILKDGGKAVIEEKKVREDIDRMREIYAQVGIRVEVVNVVDGKFVADNKLSVVDPPNKQVDLWNGLEQYFSQNPDKTIIPTAEEKALLGAATLRTPTVAGKDDIEVYYVNYLAASGNDAGTRGESFPSAWLSKADAQYADSVIISRDKKDYATLAHEVGHVLENRPAGTESHYPYDEHPYTTLDRVNLMVDAKYAVRVGSVTDSRRLTITQQDRMLSAVKRLLSDG